MRTSLRLTINADGIIQIDLEPDDELRPEGPDLAESRSLRAV